MSLIGKKINDFKAQAFHQGQFIEVTQENLQGKWSILFFYPADFTFVCPTELEDLANLYPKFEEVGAEIYSVSTDTHFSHKAWHDSSEVIGKIRFPMIGDPTGRLTRDLDSFIEEDGMAERSTFVINPEGKVVSYEVSAGNVGRSAKELLRKVKALQFVHEHGDKVCPANWEEGEDTLSPSIDLVGKI